MKRTLLTAAFLLCASGAAAEPADFERANRLYEGSNFSEAVREYRALGRQYPRSAAVHYNLGNAYFRLETPGSLGRATVSYLRAFELEPRDEDIRHNLAFTLRRAGERLIPAGTPAALFVLFHAFSAAELAALQWLGFWLALLLGALYLLRENTQAKLRPWLAGAMIFWAAFACWWGARAAIQDKSPGVVILHDAEVRSGPGANFPVSFKLPEGRRISQIDTKGGWLEIGVRKEGLKGWVHADAIEKI